MSAGGVRLPRLLAIREVVPRTRPHRRAGAHRVRRSDRGAPRTNVEDAPRTRPARADEEGPGRAARLPAMRQAHGPSHKPPRTQRREPLLGVLRVPRMQGHDERDSELNGGPSRGSRCTSAAETASSATSRASITCFSRSATDAPCPPFQSLRHPRQPQRRPGPVQGLRRAARGPRNVRQALPGTRVPLAHSATRRFPCTLCPDSTVTHCPDWEKMAIRMRAEDGVHR